MALFLPPRFSSETSRPYGFNWPGSISHGGVLPGSNLTGDTLRQHSSPQCRYRFLSPINAR